MDQTRTPAAPAPRRWLTGSSDLDAALFTELAAHGADALVLVGPDGSVIWANDQVTALLGWTPDDLVGRPVEVLVPVAAKGSHRAHRERFGEHPTPRSMGPRLTLAAVHADGTEVPVEISLTPLSVGGAGWVAAAIRDATVRRTTEAALQASEERLRTSLDSMLDGFAVFESVRVDGRIADFRFGYVNDAGATTFGQPAVRLVGSSLSGALPGFATSAFFAEYVRVVETGRPWESATAEYRDAVMSGTFELRAWRLGDGFAVTWRDVTAATAAEAAVRAGEDRFRQVMASLPDALSLFTAVRDDDGRVVDFRWAYANRHAGITTGYAAEELVGRTLLELLPSQAESATFSRYVDVVQTGESFVDPAFWVEDVWGDGQSRRRCFDVRASRVGDGLLVVSREVTTERAHEAQLSARQDELERSNAELKVLRELSDLLQTCESPREGHGVLEQVAPRLFVGRAGAFSVVSASRDDVERVAGWGHEVTLGRFAPEECWALRRGRAHVSGPGHPQCRHVPVGAEPVLCVPLTAQGSTLGVLHLDAAGLDAAGGTEVPTTLEGLALTTAGQVSLALANLQLRETLRTLSVRDPLTGLFNRRYMEETLAREVTRAHRTGEPLSVIQLDVDHFKRVNDRHGHDVGDSVLRALADVMRGVFRGADVICRFGGEEFSVILPSTPTEAAVARAEEVRRTLLDLRVSTRDGLLAAPTVSCGVATLPGDGTDGDSLVAAADRALYAAKGLGRDRVVTGSDLPDPRREATPLPRQAGRPAPVAAGEPLDAGDGPDGR